MIRAILRFDAIRNHGDEEEAHVLPIRASGEDGL